MPRAKKAADVITALRKRARRRIASLEKAGYTAQASYLRDLLESTYQKQAGFPSLQKLGGQSVESAIEQLKRWAKPQAPTVQARKNQQFLTEMRLAGYGFETSALGGAAASKVKVFWAATRNIWGGHPNADRAQLVMDALGTNSMEEAFHKVMNQQAGAYYEAYAQVMGTTSEGWTDESPEFEQALSEIGDDMKGQTRTYASVRR